MVLVAWTVKKGLDVRGLVLQFYRRQSSNFILAVNITSLGWIASEHMRVGGVSKLREALPQFGSVCPWVSWTGVLLEAD